MLLTREFTNTFLGVASAMKRRRIRKPIQHVCSLPPRGLKATEIGVHPSRRFSERKATKSGVLPDARGGGVFNGAADPLVYGGGGEAGGDTSKCIALLHFLCIFRPYIRQVQRMRIAALRRWPITTLLPRAREGATQSSDMDDINETRSKSSADSLNNFLESKSQPCRMSCSMHLNLSLRMALLQAPDPEKTSSAIQWG